MDANEIKRRHADLVTGERLRDMAERCRPGTSPRMRLVVQYESGGIVEVFTGALLDRLLAVIDNEAADRIDAAISGAPRE